jgi:hypothetical protein
VERFIRPARLSLVGMRELDGFRPMVFGLRFLPRTVDGSGGRIRRKCVVFIYSQLNVFLL